MVDDFWELNFGLSKSITGVYIFFQKHLPYVGKSVYIKNGSSDLMIRHSWIMDK